MRASVLFLALLLSACTAAPGPGIAVPLVPADATPPVPSGAITLSATPHRAAAGATMTLSLHNGSPSQAGYNLCTSRLETTAGVAVPSDRVCTLELRLLDPGASATYAYELPARLAPGSYRFTTTVERMDSGARGTVQSNSFQVR